jgi:uncharacterized DUF497 family protein
MKIDGFDWDAHNREKCRKHGVSIHAIESMFHGSLVVFPDEAHSQAEERLRAVGKDNRGRHIFIVFTVRERQSKTLIRPISARYMHAKEIAHYAKENPGL